MYFFDGINYTLPNAGILLENAYEIYPLYDELINIDFSKYNYEINSIEIILQYNYYYPENATAFNYYIDSFNNNYGDINEDSSFSMKSSSKYNVFYYIKIINII